MNFFVYCAETKENAPRLYMNDHVRSVFSLLSRLEKGQRGLIDTDEKQNTYASSENLREDKLRQKMTGKHFQ